LSERAVSQYGQPPFLFLIQIQIGQYTQRNFKEVNISTPGRWTVIIAAGRAKVDSGQHWSKVSAVTTPTTNLVATDSFSALRLVVQLGRLYDATMGTLK
jgi:hypothetical protein